MIRYRSLTRTAPLVLLLLMAALAAAQMPLARGSFTLPEQVRWGSTMLEPGDYTFVIQNGAVAPETLQLRHDGRIVATLLAVGREDAKFQNSSLLLQRVGDGYAVQQLRIGEVGVFTYSMRTGNRARLAQASPASTIPVNSSRTSK